MTRKLTQPLQYSYSNSFRNLYDQKPPDKHQYTKRQQPSKNQIVLQYQTADTKSKDKNSPEKKLLNQKLNSTQQFTLQNYTKRLHSNQKKYSFSVFVKQAKKKDQQRKSHAKSIQIKQQKFQNQKIKGDKKLNNHAIKTLYESFMNSENVSLGRKTSCRENQRLKTGSQDDKNDERHSHKSGRLNYQKQTWHGDNGKMHFFKTISYGHKLTSRQKEGLKITTYRKFNLMNQNQFQSHQVIKDTFLRIQKCSIQKKDENFIKECEDFKQILLKQRLQKQNKKKAVKAQADFIKLLNKNKEQNKFSKYISQSRDNKYVAERRDVKRMRKTKFIDKSGDDEGIENGIEPW